MLIRAVVNLGSDAAAVFPTGMEIDFVELGAGNGGHHLFQDLARWWDSQVSKAVLGQTMTTDDGASLSQGQFHNEDRLDLLAANARQLASTIARDMLRPYIDLNRGPQQQYPALSFQIDAPRDLKALAEALFPLIDRGLRVEKSAIDEWFGLPTPEDGASVLRPLQQTDQTLRQH